MLAAPMPTAKTRLDPTRVLARLASPATAKLAPVRQSSLVVFVWGSVSSCVCFEVLIFCCCFSKHVFFSGVV
jgi:hypothetical protein